MGLEEREMIQQLSEMKRKAEKYDEFAGERVEISKTLLSMSQTLKDMAQKIDPASTVYGMKVASGRTNKARMQEIIDEVYVDMSENDKQYSIQDVLDRYPELETTSRAGQVFQHLRSVKGVEVRKEGVKNIAFVK